MMSWPFGRFCSRRVNVLLALMAPLPKRSAGCLARFGRPEERVPVVHAAAEVLQKNQWNAALSAEAAVGIADPFGLDESSRCGDVGVAHDAFP